MKHRIRLAHKLILLVVLTVAVSVIVPGMLVIRIGTRALHRAVAKLTESEARSGALLVERLVKEDARQVVDLGYQLDEVADQPAAREAVVRRWLERNERAVVVGTFGGNKNDSWSVRRGFPTRSEPVDLAHEPENLPAYGDISVGIEHRPDAEDLLVVAARPSEDQPIPLVTKWRLGEFSERLREVATGRIGTIAVVDHRGLLIAHPRYRGTSATGGSLPAVRPGTDLSHLGIVRDVLEKRPASRMRYQNELGEEVVARGVMIPGLRWGVIAQQPADTAMAPVEEMKAQVLLSGLTTGLVAVLLGLAIVGTITKPLEELAEAANRVGAGDLTHPVGVATQDEIGQLALAFNEMQIRLRDMYNKLERMVSGRTHELQETTDFLNSVLDSSTEYSIIATDLHGTILSYNEGARRMYGYEPEEIIGAPVTILIPDDPEQRGKTRQILDQVRAQGTYAGETVRVRKGGESFPARFVMTVRYDEAGAPAGYTTISQDVTERKKLEAQLREYTENLESLVASKTKELRDTNLELERANKLKAEFLANMSHELRTPLNAIIGFGDALGDELAGPLNEDQKQFVEDIRSSGRQLLNLINDILDLSKVDAGRMELQVGDVSVTDVFEEVQTIVQGMAVRKGLALSFHEDPEGIMLRADRVKLLQILYNLLSNAVKFTPDGGSIRAEAERRDEDVRFRVRDTGLGIAPESLEVIFEEFHQVDNRLSREHGGTGLGLALTRKMVELHGGTITVHSTPGEGSEFTFTIPNELPVDADGGALFTSPTG